MSDISREAIDKLLDGATPPPWRIGEDQCIDDTWSIITTSGGSIIANVNDRHDRLANARFLALSRDLVPALRDALDAAEAEVARLTEHIGQASVRAENAEDRAEAAEAALATARDDALREAAAMVESVVTPYRLFGEGGSPAAMGVCEGGTWRSAVESAGAIRSLIGKPRA